MRPLIGILLDYEAAGGFSSRPHHALRTAYFDAVWRAGGTPVGLGYVDGSADALLDRLQGLILPGGFYPFPADLYGRAPKPGEEVHPRARFEQELIAALLEAQVPTLGICAGMQAVAGHLGAVLYEDIAADPGGPIDHLNARPAEEAAHGVEVTPGTLLHKITGETAFEVNTAHNEALKSVPDTLVINARAPDGIIEGIEVPDQPFCLGVQWHPEFFLETGPNLKLFQALVDRASQ